MHEEARNHYNIAQEVGNLMITVDSDLIDACYKLEEAKHNLEIAVAEVTMELEKTDMSKTALKDSVPKDDRVIEAKAEVSLATVKKKGYELTRERYIMKHSLERKAMNIIESEIRRLGG